MMSVAPEMYGALDEPEDGSDVGFALDEEVCERARLARDSRFDGRFFIGVTTTRVYCRPICPVPPPKRQHVRYFPSAAAAAEAGFRPCLRCRPEVAPGTPAWTGTAATVTRGLRLIAEGALDDGNVEQMALRLGIGGRHLRRLFVRHLGATPTAVAATRRLHFAKQLLDETALSMADVAFTSGFGSVRRFNAVIRETYGRSPSELRRKRRARPGGGFVLGVAYRPPLDWAGLLEFLAARAIPGVEEVVGNTYRRTFELAGQRGCVAVTPGARGFSLELTAELDDPRPLQQLVARTRSLFDLDADPSRIAAQLEADPRLASAVEVGGIRVPGAWDGFETAVRAVLGQQITVRGATTLAGRLAATYGQPLAGGTGTLDRLFPRPAVLAGADLVAIGLTRSRAVTLRRLAEAVAAGEICLDGSVAPARVKAQLCALPGIGPWTAEYVAMRALREPDAFPASDLGLRRGLAPAGANGRGLLSPAGVAAAAESWRPFRAYGAIAVWQGSLGAGEERGLEA